MKIRITRACGIAGVSHGVGAVVDVSDRDARLLIAIGKAAAAPDEAPPAPAVMTTEAADAVVKTARRRK